MKIKETPSEKRALKDWNRWQKSINKKANKNKKKKKVAWYQKELDSLKHKSYYSFLKSKYWEWVRKMVMTRDKFKCTVCGSDKNLQVHHTTYRNHFKEHRHLEDLLTCCNKCHKEYHLYCEVD